MTAVYAPHVQRVVEALGATATRREGRWRACCPAHGDTRPSLDVDLGADGRILLRCRSGGCSPADIVAAVGLKLSDLFEGADDRRNGQAKRSSPPPRRKADPGPRMTLVEAVAACGRSGRVSGHWVYRDAAGADAMLVVRIDHENGKSFRQFAADGDGWRWGSPEGPRPLYRLPELLADPGREILIVEGEKAADRLVELGLAATTSAGGAQGSARTDWSPLADHDVVLLPDHDEPGRDYAKQVAGILQQLDPPARVRVLELPGLLEAGEQVGEGDDIADLIDRRRAAGIADEDIAEQVAVRLEGATEVQPKSPAQTPPRSRRRSLADIRQVRFPRQLVGGVLALGTTTLLAAHPNVGKSTLAIAWAHSLLTGRPWCGRRVLPGSSLFVLGEDANGAGLRSLAWALEHGQDEDTGGRYIEFADRSPGLMSSEGTHELRALLEACVADHGHAPSLVVLDTVSTVWGGENENDNGEAARFVRRLNDLAEEFGCTILLIHHLSKVEGEITLRAIRGASAFGGNTDDVLAMSDEGDGRVKLWGLKGRNSGKAAAVHLQLHPVRLGQNEDGDDVFSVILRPGDPVVEESDRERDHRMERDARYWATRAVDALRKLGGRARNKSQVTKRFGSPRDHREKSQGWDDALTWGWISKVGPARDEWFVVTPTAPGTVPGAADDPGEIAGSVCVNSPHTPLVTGNPVPQASGPGTGGYRARGNSVVTRVVTGNPEGGESSDLETGVGEGGPSDA